MKRSNRFWILPLAGALSLLAAGCGKESGPIAEPKPPAPAENETLRHIFKSGDGGYSCFRIPALIKTKTGILLAFAEARKDNCSDEGNIDLVVKRSLDNGRTWSAMATVWNDGNNTCGNPAPVVDQNTGKIHLLMTWNLGTDDISTINNGTSTDTRRVYKTSSTDEGVTWAPVQEITSSVKNPNWGWYATGPCHGMQISGGPAAGRLVIPCDYIERGSGRKGYSHVIYSDDAGTTWKIGGISPTIALNPNESTVAELSDNRLMLNMRVSNNGNLRMKSTSSNGGLTWTTPVNAVGLVDPVCQGSLINTAPGSQHALYFSNPAATSRTNMTIKQSVDNGETWPKAYSVFKGPSGYSDLVILSADSIGILHEGGLQRYTDGIAYKNVGINQFK